MLIVLFLPLFSVLITGVGIVGVAGATATTVGGRTAAGAEDPASVCGLSLTLERDLLRRMYALLGGYKLGYVSFIVLKTHPTIIILPVRALDVERRLPGRVRQLVS